MVDNYRAPLRVHIFGIALTVTPWVLAISDPNHKSSSQSANPNPNPNPSSDLVLDLSLLTQLALFLTSEVSRTPKHTRSHAEQHA